MNVNQTNAPYAVFNFADSRSEDELPLRTVVVDKDGLPKPLAGVSVENSTTYQVFDANAGDILLQCDIDVNDEDEIDSTDIKVIGKNLSPQEDEIEAVLNEEVATSIVQFLTNKDTSVRYFTLSGYTDNINGAPLNEMYARRKKIGELFDNVNPSIKDRMVNWLDKPEHEHIIDKQNLNWDASTALPDELVVSTSVSFPSDNANVSGTSCVVWRKNEEGELHASYHDLASTADQLINDNTREIRLVENVSLGDDVVKILSFSVVQESLIELSLYHRDGIPADLVPEWLVNTTLPDYHGVAFEDIPAVKSHLTALGISDDDWDGLNIHDIEDIYTNVAAEIPIVDLTPEQVLEHIEKITRTKDNWAIYSSDDGNSHAVIGVTKEDNKAIVIMYKQEDDELYEELDEEEDDASSSSE